MLQIWIRLKLTVTFETAESFECARVENVVQAELTACSNNSFLFVVVISPRQRVDGIFVNFAKIQSFDAVFAVVFHEHNSTVTRGREHLLVCKRIEFDVVDRLRLILFINDGADVSEGSFAVTFKPFFLQQLLFSRESFSSIYRLLEFFLVFFFLLILETEYLLPLSIVLCFLRSYIV